MYRTIGLIVAALMVLSTPAVAIAATTHAAAPARGCGSRIRQHVVHRPSRSGFDSEFAVKFTCTAGHRVVVGVKCQFKNGNDGVVDTGWDWSGITRRSGSTLRASCSPYAGWFTIVGGWKFEYDVHHHDRWSHVYGEWHRR